MQTILGKPISGIKLGREIGCPTINCKIESIKGNIPYGVYTCYLIEGEKKHNGVMHYGPKSIGDSGKSTVYCEVHLLNYKKDGKMGNIKIGVLSKIRDIRKFKNKQSLKKQIKKDICMAKNYFYHD